MEQTWKKSKYWDQPLLASESYNQKMRKRLKLATGLHGPGLPIFPCVAWSQECTHVSRTLGSFYISWQIFCIGTVALGEEV